MVKFVNFLMNFITTGQEFSIYMLFTLVPHSRFYQESLASTVVLLLGLLLCDTAAGT